MNSSDAIAALDMPSLARVDRRVPKKLFVENGAFAAGDRRRINEGLEEVSWVASLKPTTIGVPEFREPTREYAEIAVLHAVLRGATATARLLTLVHRAVPYPVLLVATQGIALTFSLANKRHSQSGAESTVLDGAMIVVDIGAARKPCVCEAFLREMALSRLPRSNLFALYQGWIDTLVALLAADRTGIFTIASSPKMALARRAALAECDRLDAQMIHLRAAAAKERQVARQVDLNLEIKRLEAALFAAIAKM